jgi:hypothetical protein
MKYIVPHLALLSGLFISGALFLRVAAVIGTVFEK